ncbi:hypothetical protein BKA69DRAFT_1036030 [Paraphysoderma sedebokerense]|nr:hypothetical protein BKA69DRAFT_1036030 [Paraphysoderma sedebokerense]
MGAQISTDYVFRPERKFNCVFIRGAKWVDRIELRGTSAEVCGGTGGVKTENFQLDSNEHIVEVFGRRKEVIQSIGFQTSSGRIIGPIGGSTMGAFGKEDGWNYHYPAPEGHRLISLRMRTATTVHGAVVGDVNPLWATDETFDEVVRREHQCIEESNRQHLLNVEIEKSKAQTVAANAPKVVQVYKFG